MITLDKGPVVFLNSFAKVHLTPIYDVAAETFLIPNKFYEESYTGANYQGSEMEFAVLNRHPWYACCCCCVVVVAFLVVHDWRDELFACLLTIK